MIVDEAWDDGCTLDVDDFRVRTCVASQLRARAARDDTTIVDRERFDDTEVRVDGQNLAVRDDGVGLLLRKRRSARDRSEYAASDSQALESFAQRAQAEFDVRDIHTTTPELKSVVAEGNREPKIPIRLCHAPLALSYSTFPRSPREQIRF